MRTEAEASFYFNFAYRDRKTKEERVSSLITHEVLNGNTEGLIENKIEVWWYSRPLSASVL